LWTFEPRRGYLGSQHPSGAEGAMGDQVLVSILGGLILYFLFAAITQR
jgi:hypothetical protein